METATFYIQQEKYSKMRFKTFLNEEVKLLKYFNNSSNQVVDLGIHGWFHIYSVNSLDENPDAELSLDGGNDIKEGKNRVISLAEYKKDKFRKFTTKDQVIERKLKDIQNWSKEATKRLYSLGIKKQKQTVVIADLSHERNNLTGGGIGGYADRSKHGIALNKSELKYGKDSFLELLIHETAHIIHLTTMPKHTKKAFRKWFDDNIENVIDRNKKSYNDAIVDTLYWTASSAFTEVKGISPLGVMNVVNDKPLNSMFPVDDEVIEQINKRGVKFFKRGWDAIIGKMMKELLKDDRIMHIWKSDVMLEMWLWNWVEGGFTGLIEGLGNRFNPERDVKERMIEQIPEQTIPQAEIKRFRSKLQDKGIAPTAYATYNDNELMAEMISYLANAPDKVSKELKKVFKKVLQGDL